MKWLCFVFCLLLSTAAIAGERRALVLGNGSYQHSDPLRNARNDAADVADTLRRMGFDVTEGIDLTRAETMHLVQDFAFTLEPSDTALFFYAGHATQIGSQNVLMPIDAQSGTEGELLGSSVSLQSVLATFENRARTRIIILDACRNNPFLVAGATRSGGASRGLFRMEAGVGSYIAYSTAPGNVADDGTGRNSPFTASLLSHLPRAGEDVHALMRRVRADVMHASGNRQIPWENSALIDEVFLAAPRVQPSLAPTLPQTTTAAVPQASQTPQQYAAAFQPTHQVQGLDPNGDGFLALRSGPGSQNTLLFMLTEGTPLRATGQSGRWMQVESPEGIQGWAHSNWIRPLSASVRAPLTPVAPQPITPARQTCDQLWFERNSYFAARGYCFQSARGQAAFSNANCIPGMSAGDTPLSAAERARVSEIRRQEKAQGCR